MKLTEFNNRAIKCVNRCIHNAYYKIVTNIEYVYLKAIGIKLGYGCQFKGWTSVFIENHSEISIGNQCSFNSDSYTNHIGLNHKCIISTMTEKASISIGNNCGFSGSIITCFKRIEIGDNVRVGANCVIMDGDFHLDDPRTPQPQRISIADNVWLGAGVVVMKGVSIGENTIIGMNSVITKDISSNCIAAGCPCKVIKQLKNV